MSEYRTQEPEMTALEARTHLVQLETERALAQTTELAGVRAYMADLEEEIEETRRAYTLAAVLEIASLRAELFGEQVG
ncbi:MAG TPA: hypothetical protein VGF25_11040 [Thermoleophilaceae bacterium]|jgi:hypothetical protein